VELVGTVARKRGPTERLAVEADVTSRAAMLGQRSGAFFVPPVARFDAAEGLLETQRVLGFRSLLELALAHDPVVPALCARLGRAIALVHRELSFDATVTATSVTVLRWEDGALAAIHGDLTASNVGHDRTHDRLVILDWAATPALGELITRGTPYFDVLWFMSFFFRNRPLWALINWSPEAWCDAFIEGYRAGGGNLSAEGFRQYAKASRSFLQADYQRELHRRARGVRWLPYRVWRAMGWRRWERYLEHLRDAGPSMRPTA
jgi:hypothetical protein